MFIFIGVCFIVILFSIIYNSISVVSRILTDSYVESCQKRCREANDTYSLLHKLRQKTAAEKMEYKKQSTTCTEQQIPSTEHSTHGSTSTESSLDYDTSKSPFS